MVNETAISFTITLTKEQDEVNKKDGIYGKRLENTSDRLDPLIKIHVLDESKCPCRCDKKGAIKLYPEALTRKNHCS